MADSGYTDMQLSGDPSLPRKIIDIKKPADLDLSDLTIAINNVASTVLDGTFYCICKPI
jgi:hypothetical protein